MEPRRVNTNPLFRGSFALAVVASLLVSITGCNRQESGNQTSQGSAATSQTPATRSVDIGYSRLRISLPIFVAKEMKLFEKHGVAANLIVYDTAQPMIQALVEGKVPLAGYAAIPITYAGMLRSGTPLYFTTLMMEDEKHRISYLLRRKPKTGEQPIIRQIGDLKGKRVGILPTIAYRSWLQAILKANGVDPTSVTIQDVEPLLEVQTLASGGVDALFTNDPPATAAIVNGAGELITDFVEVPRYLGEPFPFGSFNAVKSWVDTHQQEFAGVVGALDEAIEYVNSHPAEAKKFMAPYLPEAFRGHVEKYPDALYLTSRDAIPGTFERAAEDYLKLGIIQKPINLSGLVYSR